MIFIVLDFKISFGAWTSGYKMEGKYKESLLRSHSRSRPDFAAT
jgi:hypothetical protein